MGQEKCEILILLNYLTCKRKPAAITLQTIIFVCGEVRQQTAVYECLISYTSFGSHLLCESRQLTTIPTQLGTGLGELFYTVNF